MWKKSRCMNDRALAKGIAFGLITLILIISICDPAWAAQTNESRGKGGYGWQQVYEVFNAATGSATRITGTADRAMYDYGFKPIQISGRKENYWSRDCGWWYVSSESTVNVKVWDGAGDQVYSQSSLGTTKGRRTETLSWGSDDDPGEWTAKVDDGTTVAVFKFFVRGKLNVTSISTNPANPNKGQSVTISATIKDNAGNIVSDSETANNGTATPITVKAYVTGAGENFVVALVDDGTGADSGGSDDGVWRGTFTPNAVGDHKIKVKATDGHAYWVDGSGSGYVSVKGPFPYASIALSFIEGFIGGVRNTSTSILTALGAGLVILSALLSSRRPII